MKWNALCPQASQAVGALVLSFPSESNNLLPTLQKPLVTWQSLTSIIEMRTGCLLVFCAGLLAVGVRGAEAVELDVESTTALFHKMDANKDGGLSKKEFYYALMEDEFEALSTKHAVPSLELEFEVQDQNSDRRITIEEWKAIFSPVPLETQTSEFIKQEIEKSEQAARAQREKEKDSSPPPPPPPPPPPTPPPPSPPATAQRGSAISTPPVPNTMHVGPELVMPDKRKFYLAEDATWLEVEAFCAKRSARLCKYEELCPQIVNDVSNEDKDDRWVPVHGPAHKWMELANCGMTLWPDYIKHRGLLCCCEDPPPEPAAAEPAAPSAETDAAAAAAESGSADATAGAAEPKAKAEL